MDSKPPSCSQPAAPSSPTPSQTRTPSKVPSAPKANHMAPQGNGTRSFFLRPSPRNEKTPKYGRSKKLKMILTAEYALPNEKGRLHRRHSKERKVTSQSIFPTYTPRLSIYMAPLNAFRSTQTMSCARLLMMGATSLTGAPSIGGRCTNIVGLNPLPMSSSFFFGKRAICSAR